MAQLTVQKITNASALNASGALTAAAGGGDSFPNTGKEFYAIKNAGGAPITLTAKASAGPNNQPCNYGIAGTPAHDKTFSITNDSNIYVVGPFPTIPFNDGSGLLQLAYSAVTSVTVIPFSLPPTQ